MNTTVEDNKNTYPDKHLTERLHKTPNVTVVAYRVKKKIKYTSINQKTTQKQAYQRASLKLDYI